MPQVTVSSGWTRPDNYFSQPDGEYRLTLKAIGATNDANEFVPGGTYEHTGMYGLKVKQSWVFHLDNGEVIEAGVTAPKDGRIHPNSTYYGYASALVGREPGTGVSFDSDSLAGLSAIGLIQRDDNDIPRITNLRAIKEQAASQAAPQAAPEPAPQPQPAPLRDELSKALPF